MQSLCVCVAFLPLIALFCAVQAPCDVTVVNTGSVSCFHGDTYINIDGKGSAAFPNDTECAIQKGGDTQYVRCQNGIWKTVTDVQQYKVKPALRHKRDLLDIIKGVFEGVTCALTLYSCLWAGRAGPRRDQTPPQFHSPCPFYYAYGEAEPFQTWAKVTWTEPTARDDVDGIITPKRISGRAPGQHFPEGLHEVKYMAKDNSGNPSYCTVQIKVTVIRCSDPPYVIKNGYYVCHPSIEFVLGGWCRFGCYEGFELDGPSYITCQRSKQWTGHFPSCKPITCPALPPIDGAGAPTCTNQHFFRSICSYNCKRGYDMPANVSKAVVCAANKTWRKHGEPKCLDIEPPWFTKCPSTQVHGTDNGLNTSTLTWPTPEVSDNSPVQVLPVLVAGGVPDNKYPVGTHRVVYRAKDGDGNEGKPCQFKVIVRDIKCPRLYPTPYLRFECPRGTRTGAICTAVCDPGKMLSKNNPEVQCKRSSKELYAQWDWGSDQQPTCESTSNCDSLKPPANGALACDYWMGGEFCQLTCRNGTKMAGIDLNRLYTCSKRGDWWPKPMIRPCKLERMPRAHFGIEAQGYFDGECTTNAAKNQIAQHFIGIMNSSPFAKEACPSTLECRVDNIQIFCGESSRHRRGLTNDPAQDKTIMNKTELRIKFQFPIKWTLTEDNFGSVQVILTTFVNVIQRVMLVNTTAMFQNTSLKLTDVQNTGIELHCPAGSTMSHSYLSCVDCPEGTQYVAYSGSCESCPKGYYQDIAGSLTCKRCPSGTTTSGEGGQSLTDCEESCSPGYFSRNGVQPCSPCSIGSYQPSHGQTTCRPCPGSTSTLLEGTESARDCHEFDIEFLDKQAHLATLTIPEPAYLQDFSISFWFRASSNHTLSVHLYDNNDTLLWSLHNLHTVTRGLRTSEFHVRFEDRLWHQVLVKDTNCNTVVHVDGMPITISGNGSQCDAILVSKLSIEADYDFDGIISQINVWNNSLNLLLSKCFISKPGDIISWQYFAEANITGGHLSIPSQCDDFDNCLSSPCYHGECQDDLDTFQCNCHAGFTGVQCETNIDDCEVHVCMGNSTCVDGVESYTCTCKHGYTGVYCEIQVVDGIWSGWGTWSECSSTCGDGEQRRSHVCTNPAPQNGGQDCIGPALETRDCNNTECPICPQLQAPANGSVTCDNTSDVINCTIACNDGYDFDIEPLLEYFCGQDTFYEWNFQYKENSERRLPSCVAITLPEKVTVHYTARYQDLFCTDSEVESEVESSIYDRVLSTLMTVPCLKENNCVVEKVSIHNCGKSRLRNRETAGFTMIFSVKPDSGINGTTSLSSLQDAFKLIQTAADDGQFTIEVLDNVYLLASNLTDVSGQVRCRQGTMRVKFYCVPCGAGAFFYVDYCKPCPVGTFQEKEAQMECSLCPDGKTTTGILSKSIEDCSVEILVANMDPVTITAAIAGSCSVLIVAALAALAYRRYSFRSKKFVVIQLVDLKN